MRFSTILTFLSSFIFVSCAPPNIDWAAQRGCATTITEWDIVLAATALKERKALAKSVVSGAEKVEEVVSSGISVAWHIVYENETLEGGFLSEDQVEDSLTALNEHYNTTGISFNLTVIDRAQNSSWFIGADPVYTDLQDEMKRTLRVGDVSMLNIYSVGFEARTNRGLLGYSTYPWVYENNTLDDGVVIHHSSLPGGSIPHFDEGKTLTHEIGHWLGLYHPFQGGCNGNGDFVDDTPPQVKTTAGCPDYQDSCPGDGVDSIHNFMDYSYDSCMFEFTAGQAARAREQILYFRNITIPSPIS